MIRSLLAVAFAFQISMPALAQMQSGAAGSASAGSAASGAIGAAGAGVSAPTGGTFTGGPSVTLGGTTVAPLVVSPSAKATTRQGARSEVSAASGGIALPTSDVASGVALTGGLAGSAVAGALKGSPEPAAPGAASNSRAAAVGSSDAAPRVSPAPQAPSSASPGVMQRIARRARSMAAALGIGVALMGALGNAAPVIAQEAPQGRPAIVLQLQKAQLPAPAFRLLAAGASQAQSGQVLQAARVTDAISQGNGQNLIVVGNVGLDDAAQQALARDVAGKHFVIVLVANPDAEVYTDANGTTRYGEDAVDYATGHGLARKGAFKAWKNQALNESDGAVITFMVGRAYLYYASPALDARGAGNNNFQGDLLNVVRTPIRATGDIAGGMKALIAEVESRMETAVRNETVAVEASVSNAKAKVSETKTAYTQFAKDHPAAARRVGKPDFEGAASKIKAAEGFVAQHNTAQASQAAGEVVRDMSSTLSAIRNYESTADGAKTQIKGAEEAIAALTDAAASFKREHSGASGALSRPDVGALTRQVAEAKKTLAEGDAPGASASAQAAAEQARALSAAIAGYPGFAPELAAQQARVSELSGRSFAATAKGDLDRATEQLAAAERAYQDAEPGYLESLNAAKGTIDSARVTIEAAQARADADAAATHRNNMILLGILTILTGGLAFGLYLGRRRVLVLKAAADTQLTKLRTALDTSLSTMKGKLANNLELWGKQYKGKPGKTGKLADMAINDVEGMPSLEILWLKTDGILNGAIASTHPSNPLRRAYNAVNPGFRLPIFGEFPSVYQTALDRLKQPIEFQRSEFGEKAEWTEDLTVSNAGEKGRTVSRSFEELIKEYDFRVKRAAESLKAIEDAVLEVGPALEEAAKKVANANGLKGAVDKAGASDGLFLIPAVFATLLAAAAKSIAAATAAKDDDPVGAMQGTGAEGVRMAKEAEEISSWVVALREGDLKTVYAAEAALKAAGVGAEWIEDKLHKLSGRADALAPKGIEGSVAEKLGQLKADAAALAAQAAEAAKIEGDRQAAVRDRIDAAKKTVGDARGTIAAGVNAARTEAGIESRLSPDDMLHEKGSDPDANLKSASDASDAAKKALGKGDNEAAKASLSELNRQSAQALSHVARAKFAVDGRVAVVQARFAETDRLDKLVGGAKAVLDGIIAKYADSVLSLGGGDASHTEGNGTIKDNIDEAKTSLASAGKALDSAKKAFTDGKVLSAADLLAEIRSQQQFAEHRLNEIGDKKIRLDYAVAANERSVAALEARATTNQREIYDDPKVMEPTQRLFAEAKRLTQSARKTVDAPKGDPFKAGEAIASAQAEWSRIESAAASDRQVFAHAESSVRAAEQQYRAAVESAHRAKNDPIPDNDKLDRAYRELGEVQTALEALGRKLSVGHADWHAVDAEADRQASRTSTIAADIRRQVEAGEQAMSALSQANADVRAAQSWTGSYNVHIPGNPGAQELQYARTYLERGEYDNSIQYAREASRQAAEAIAIANAEVHRRHQQELDRIEAERRERERQEQAARDERDRQAREEQNRRVEQARRDEQMNSGNSHGGGGGNMESGNSRGEA